MPKAVLDTTVLVSAFLNAKPGGVSYELLRFAEKGTFTLFVSDAILLETVETLINHARARRRYQYVDADIVVFCKEVEGLARIVRNVPQVQLVRDPNDDMILACAIAAGADYLVSRDKDLLSLGGYEGIEILSPEAFLQALRKSTEE